MPDARTLVQTAANRRETRFSATRWRAYDRRHDDEQVRQLRGSEGIQSCGQR